MSSAKILMVEDEAILALDMQSRLEDMGHNVVAVLDRAEEALPAVQQHDPDAVLMDIHTPGSIDGIDAARAIVDAEGTPVVFVTAYGDPQTVERAKGVGPFGYLLKPIQDRELYATMEVILVKATLWRQLNAANEELERKVRELSALNGLFQKQIAEQLGVADAFRFVSREVLTVHRELTDALDRAYAADVPINAQAIDAVALLQRATKLDEVVDVVKKHIEGRESANQAFHRLFDDLKRVEGRIEQSAARVKEVDIPTASPDWGTP